MKNVEAGDWRYERKLRLERLEPAQLISLIRLHPARLRELYPPRYINNVYFDTPRRTCFHRHQDGVSHRQKVRVRWYGDLRDPLERVRLEFKQKAGRVMTKPVFALPDTTLAAVVEAGGLLRLARSGGCPPAALETVAHLEAVLVNRYRREYYQTIDRRVRVTIDTDMSFFTPVHAVLGLGPDYRDRSAVLEIKYDVHAVREGTDVSAHFPLPLSKNSKYVNGMQLLYG